MNKPEIENGDKLKEVYVTKSNGRYLITIHPVKGGQKIAIKLRELRELMKLKIGDLEKVEVQERIRNILNIN